MPRGTKKEITYTGKAAKVYEKVQKLEADLKAARAELKSAYAEQVKAEKAAAQKELKENRERLLKAIEESGKTPDEIIALLKGE